MTGLTYDLHIHSCLSPCGDDDMTPANIAGMAALKGLEAVALTDHNPCRNCPNIFSQSCNTSCKTSLKGNTEFIQFHWNSSKQAGCQESLDYVQCRVAYAAPAILIFNSTFKGCHYDSRHIKCPCQIRKKKHDRLHPAHFKQFSPHASHLHEKISQKSNNLTIQPVNDLSQNRICNKIHRDSNNPETTMMTMGMIKK